MCKSVPVALFYSYNKNYATKGFSQMCKSVPVASLRCVKVS